MIFRFSLTHFQSPSFNTKLATSNQSKIWCKPICLTKNMNQIPSNFILHISTSYILRVLWIPTNITISFALQIWTLSSFTIFKLINLFSYKIYYQLNLEITLQMTKLLVIFARVTTFQFQFQEERSKIQLWKSIWKSILKIQFRSILIFVVHKLEIWC